MWIGLVMLAAVPIAFAIGCILLGHASGRSSTIPSVLQAEPLTADRPNAVGNPTILA